MASAASLHHAGVVLHLFYLSSSHRLLLGVTTDSQGHIQICAVHRRPGSASRLPLKFNPQCIQGYIKSNEGSSTSASFKLGTNSVQQSWTTHSLEWEGCLEAAQRQIEACEFACQSCNIECERKAVSQPVFIKNSMLKGVIIPRHSRLFMATLRPTLSLCIEMQRSLVFQSVWERCLWRRYYAKVCFSFTCTQRVKEKIIPHNSREEQEIEVCTKMLVWKVCTNKYHHPDAYSCQEHRRSGFIYPTNHPICPEMSL